MANKTTNDKGCTGLHKLKHLQACLMPEAQYKKSAGFENVELENESSAGIDLAQVNLATSFLGHKLKAPLMISPMTGGLEQGKKLNRLWAQAAEHFGLAFGVGSQRLALLDKSVEESFKVRKYAKNILLFANLGAVQLISDLGHDDAIRAVEMIEANALFLHLNPLQEMCQEHGDKNFNGLLVAIEALKKRLEPLKIPLLVREVGFGFSEKCATQLLETGVDGLDCSGAGGTSWAKVEALCSSSTKYRRLGEVFGEWGIPTCQSIKNVRAINKKIPLIASGGLRNGLHIAKSLALGANLAGMAQPMLQAAMVGEEELFAFIEQILLELKVALAASGRISLQFAE